jgi:hypothetical protein
MAAALALLQEGTTSRHLYLYDKFEGMTPATAHDTTTDGTLAASHLANDTDKQTYWCIVDLDDVRRNMAATDYPADRITYVKGPVERTIPGTLPAGPFALLRLDTDWYESTKHELEHLFPLVSPGGGNDRRRLRPLGRRPPGSGRVPRAAADPVIPAPHRIHRAVAE